MEDKITPRTRWEIFLLDKGLAIILIFAFILIMGGSSIIQEIISTPQTTDEGVILPFILLAILVTIGWLIFYSWRRQDRPIRGFWTAIIAVSLISAPFLYIIWIVNR